MMFWNRGWLVCLMMGAIVLAVGQFAQARTSKAGKASTQVEKKEMPTPESAGNSTREGATEGMSLGQAAVLGIVEGMTEYLPVSSTGHLLIVQRAMGIGEGTKAGDPDEAERAKEASDAYAICIQAGAIIAVLGLYMKRVKEMIQGLMGRSTKGLRMVLNLAAGFLPAAVIGLICNKTIKAYLFGPWPVVTAWFVGGVAILVFGRLRASRGRERSSGKPLDELNIRMALVIGFAQCIAMWPGVSRSLATICGGLAVGLNMSAAVEFSFLLGMVTLGAATGYDALKHGHAMLQMYNMSALTLGLVTAFIAAVVSVKWMISYLNRHGLEIFGYYRVTLALGVIGLLWTGVL